ncbi:4'-phosphopantetheinyl transferase family protein [Streptomyces sp. NPDC056486]|uniref:4'-phosphopantetheinyl transferase family protein n=1 Tax=Streptomyces sp. NPDC056486 TaxID=3345835 RepID=UPI0036A4C5BF
MSIDRTCAYCGAGHGRPRFAGAQLDYSVSHTRDHVVVGVVSEGLVGVDVDTVPRRDTVDRLATKALTPHERGVWDRLPEDQRPAAFVRLWTRKEAAVKLTGHGLAAALSALDANGPELVVSGRLPASWPPHKVHLRDVRWRAGHVLALASTSPVQHVIRLSPEDLLRSPDPGADVTRSSFGNSYPTGI